MVASCAQANPGRLEVVRVRSDLPAGAPKRLREGARLDLPITLEGRAGSLVELRWIEQRRREAPYWTVKLEGPFRVRFLPSMPGLGARGRVQDMPGMVYHHGTVTLDSRRTGKHLPRVLRLEPGVEIGGSWIHGRFRHAEGEPVLRFELLHGTVEHWRHPPGLTFFEGREGETKWHNTCRMEWRREVVYGESSWFYDTSYRMTRHAVRTPRRTIGAIPRAVPPGGRPPPPPPMASIWIGRVPETPLIAVAPTPVDDPAGRRPEPRPPAPLRRPPGTTPAPPRLPPAPTAEPETTEETHAAIEDSFGF